MGTNGANANGKTAKQAERLKAALDDAELRPCEYCHELDGVRLYKNISGNGHTTWCWYCEICQRFARRESIWIKHDVVEEWVKRGRIKDLSKHKTLRDYSQDKRCAVCGQPGAEYHHFAPQALSELFGEDWGRWPGCDLCLFHHRLWHSIVTWYMRGPSAPNPEMLARYGK